MRVRPRILIIASYAESLINFRGDLINDLIRIGCEVSVAAPGLKKDSLTNSRLRNLGVSTYEIKLQRTGLNPLSDLVTIANLIKLIVRIRPDKIIAYTIKPVVYGMLAAEICNVPFRVAMITGLGYAFTEGPIGLRFYLQKLLLLMYRRSLRGSNRVIFQNPDDLNLFVDLGLVDKSKAVLVNGSGINTQVFFPVPPLSSSNVKFLLIARLIKDKGVVEYAEAAIQLKNKYPNVEFHLVGWLDDNPSCISQDELDSWVKSGAVIFHGKLEDVKPIIAQASVYVLPSYREGTPRTVLEAMSMGRPIITTDAPGCRETVQEGVNGFLVPVKDVCALGSVMEKFIQDKALIEKMGCRSREIAIEKYDVNKVNKKILEYMELS